MPAMTNTDNLDHHFGIENIPFGIASVKKKHGVSLPPQCATRVLDQVIFLAVLADKGFFKEIEQQSLASILKETTLNTLASLPKTVHRAIRQKLIEKLTRPNAPLSEQLNDNLPPGSVFPVADVQMHLPVSVGDFTDFSISAEHNLRAGEIIMGKRFLPPAFNHFPMGYGGRCSSIVVSGTPVERPLGQVVEGENEDGSKRVIFTPSRAVDYELEVAAVVGKPLAVGQRLRAADADEHIFGLVLLNDWSARDIQALEMMPLGPLNGKNFGTTISPWVITLDALAPFRASSPPRSQTTPVAPYLASTAPDTYSIDFTIEIIPSSHGNSNDSGKSNSTITCNTNLSTSMYWTFRHMLAHQAIGGAGLRTGDLLASGTVSGAAEESRGCLLELTWGGKKPIRLNDGTERAYLNDGDVVRMVGIAGEGVGFGECAGLLMEAKPWE